MDIAVSNAVVHSWFPAILKHSVKATGFVMAECGCHGKSRYCSVEMLAEWPHGLLNAFVYK